MNNNLKMNLKYEAKGIRTLVEGGRHFKTSRRFMEELIEKSNAFLLGECLCSVFDLSSGHVVVGHKVGCICDITVKYK